LARWLGNAFRARALGWQQRIDADGVIDKGETLDFGALPPNAPPSVVDMICLCLDFGEDDDDSSGSRNTKPSVRVAREVLENAYDMFKGGRFSIFLIYCWCPSSP